MQKRTLIIFFYIALTSHWRSWSFLSRFCKRKIPPQGSFPPGYVSGFCLWHLCDARCLACCPSCPPHPGALLANPPFEALACSSCNLYVRGHFDLRQILGDLRTSFQTNHIFVAGPPNRKQNEKSCRCISLEEVYILNIHVGQWWVNSFNSLIFFIFLVDCTLTQKIPKLYSPERTLAWQWAAGVLTSEVLVWGWGAKWKD